MTLKPIGLIELLNTLNADKEVCYDQSAKQSYQPDSIHSIILDHWYIHLGKTGQHGRAYINKGVPYLESLGAVSNLLAFCNCTPIKRDKGIP